MADRDSVRTEACVAREEELRIISRAQRGNADAFRALVEAYKERLFAFIWRMVRDHHEAEDICQSAFVKAYESIQSYSPQYAFSTWLFTIGYRLCLNQLRRRRKSTTDLELVQSQENETPETIAASAEAKRLRDRIWAAVDELSDAQRGAVLLFYREGKSCQEIGQILGMPAVTVKSHLHRARARLRDNLGANAAEWDVPAREPRLA